MKILIIFLSLILSACANFNIKRNDEFRPDGPGTTINLVYLAWGFIPVEKIPPAAQLCPQGRLEMVRLSRTNGDTALTWLTLGIYVPQRATVFCGR